MKKFEKIQFCPKYFEGLLGGGGVTLRVRLTAALTSFLHIWAKCTDFYIRIDRKLDPARLPRLLDVFQQLLPPLCICARTS